MRLRHRPPRSSPPSCPRWTTCFSAVWPGSRLTDSRVRSTLRRRWRVQWRRHSPGHNSRSCSSLEESNLEPSASALLHAVRRGRLDFCQGAFRFVQRERISDRSSRGRRVRASTLPTRRRDYRTSAEILSRMPTSTPGSRCASGNVPSSTSSNHGAAISMRAEFPMNLRASRENYGNSFAS